MTSVPVVPVVPIVVKSLFIYLSERSSRCGVLCGAITEKRSEKDVLTLD